MLLQETIGLCEPLGPYLEYKSLSHLPNLWDYLLVTCDKTHILRNNFGPSRAACPDLQLRALPHLNLADWHLVWGDRADLFG
jgi:hypothetical protein